jgi:hypothetical protein
MKTSELARIMECNERSIRRHKQTLIEIGYDIRGFSGTKGGMELYEVTLSAAEWEILRDRLKKNPEIYDKISYRLLDTI